MTILRDELNRMMGGFFISTFLVKDYYNKKSPAKVLQKY
jgi:hypothetical protein